MTDATNEVPERIALGTISYCGNYENNYYDLLEQPVTARYKNMVRQDFSERIVAWVVNRRADKAIVGSVGKQPAAGDSQALWKSSSEQTYVMRFFAISEAFGCNVINNEQAADLFAAVGNDRQFTHPISGERRKVLHEKAAQLGLHSAIGSTLGRPPNCNANTIQAVTELQRLYGLPVNAARQQ